MTSQEKVSNKRSFEDGKLEIKESYLNGELDLVTLVDSRERTVDQLYGNRTVEVSFIFRVEDDRLELSRIFANSEKGGHALDTKRSIFGGFTTTYRRRDLLDDSSLELLRSDYPGLAVDTQRLRDKVRRMLSKLS